MASNATAALPPYLQNQLAHADDDRRVIYTIVTALTIPLVWLAVALRFLARHYSVGHFGWDDWFMILAMVFGTGFLVVDFLGVFYGGGRHIVLILQDEAAQIAYAKITLAAEVMYPTSLIFPKLSLLFLYRRLFPSRQFLYWTIAVGTLTMAYTLCAILVPFGQCIPFEKIWITTAPGYCINIAQALTVFGALNIITDAAILTLPIPMIFQLHTSLGTKAQLSALFLTGTLVTVISIARVIYTSRIDFTDPTWTQIDAVAWTSAEVCTAIISACLPTYRPLFDKGKRKQTAAYEYSNSKGSRGFKTSDIDDDVPLRSKITVQTDIQSTWGDHRS